MGKSDHRVRCAYQEKPMIFTNNRHSPHRSRNKSLGIPELIAIALGGMVGGGILTVLGISVAIVGAYTPLVIIIGGVIKHVSVTYPHTEPEYCCIASCRLKY